MDAVTDIKSEPLSMKHWGIRRWLSSNVLATGFAMFSMFFGAGNIIFPLLLGQYAGDKNIFVICGLIISAVLVPFLGLFGIVLFQGSYHNFFARVGKIPGFCIVLMSMLLIGPFGGIPRLIAFSHSQLAASWPDLNYWLFGLVACALVLLCTIKEFRVVKLIGYVLTPILLLSLGVVAVLGLVNHPEAPAVAHTNLEVFTHGLLGGYNTLDLIASFFFSAFVLESVSKNQPVAQSSHLWIVRIMSKASIISGGLLILIYVSFSYISSFYPVAVPKDSQDQIMALIALRVLGPLAGFVTNCMVIMACLTTAIALASIFAEYVGREIFRGKVGYIPCLIGTMIVTFAIASLKFMGIVKLLAPILWVCYPSLIVLAIVNIAYKLFNFRMVKTPVYITFFGSLTHYLWYQLV